MNQNLQQIRLYTGAAVLLATGFTWLAVSYYRAQIGATGSWGNAIIAGLGLGLGSGFLYYAAVFKKGQDGLKKRRGVATLIAVVTTISMTVSTAVISGVRTF